MAGQYSHRQFFRKVPNQQLADYFASRDAVVSLDFAELKESDVDAVFAAFSELTEEQQGVIEAEFQDVNALACDAGIQALLDEAGFHQDEAFAESLAAIDGLHAKVMWVLLNKQSYWRGASLFLHADQVSPSYWKKRNDLPNVPPNVEEVDIQQLAAGISAYFHTTEGRGKNCKVEPYRRHQKEYFFAYPEDYAQSGVEWVSDALKTRARHPAFEIIFVYSQAEGFLDIYAPKNTKAVPELQKVFAKTILQLNTLEDGQIDQRVYDLKPVGEQGFNFQVEPDTGIHSVEVTRLRLKLLHGANTMRRITLEASTQQNPNAVYDLLAELKPPAHIIDQVGLKVVFQKANGKTSTKRFNIGYPNSCALGYDGIDLKIRQLLIQSGLEPQHVVE